MTNQVNVPSTGATQAPERTDSTPDARTLKLVVTSAATVLVATAITATGAFLIADEAPTTGVFGDQAARAAQAAEQQLVNGIHPATDLADILRFGAGAGAVPADEVARMEALVDGIDPATNVPEALGLEAVRAQDDTPAVEQLVWGIDPSIDVRAVLGLNDPEEDFDRGPSFSSTHNVR
jgi:hypothetical protein